jgi:hypothetical protein
MANTHRQIAAALVLTLLAGATHAQDSPPGATPAAPPASKAASSPQDVEPAVDTSAPAASAAQPSATSVPGEAAPKSPATASKATRAAKAGAAHPAQAPDNAAAGAAKNGAKDRMALDATQITGNRELPKVLYIVPWKHSDLSDLAGRPSNSLLDEVLAPVDRDVFQRENRYYDALQPDAGQAGKAAASAAAPPARDEK